MATDLLQLDFVVKQVGLDKALTQTAKFEREIMKTVKAYEKGQITQDRYRKSLLNVKRDLVAYTKAWGNSSLSIQKANAVVQRFVGNQNTLNSSLNAGSAAAQQTARKTNQLGVLMQQSGYQIGDFAVQVQSGTNVMVALGQQATQLVGTFAMLAKSTAAIAAFSALGVIVPIVTAIAGAFMRTAKSAEEAEEKVSGLTKTLKDFKQEQRALTQGITTDQLGLVDRINAIKELQQEFLKAAETAGGITGAKQAAEAEAVIDVLNSLLLKASEQQVDLQEKINKELRDRVISMGEANTLASIENKLGKDSQQYRDEARRQAERALELEIQASGVSVNVANRLRDRLKTEYDIIDAKADQDELDRLALARQEAITNSTKAALAVTKEMTAAIEEREAAVKEIQKTHNDELKNLEDQIDLIRVEAQYGKDSLELEAAKAAQAREAYKQSRIDAGIKGNLLELEMRTYDELQRQKEILDDINEEERQRLLLVKEQLKFYERQADRQIRLNQSPMFINTDSLDAAAKIYKDRLKEMEKEQDEAAKAAEKLNDKIRELEDAADPFREYNRELKDLDKLLKAGKISQEAYNKAVDDLNEGLGDSIRIIGDVEQAFSDWLMRGFDDFKSFVSDIVNSFKQMLVDMAAAALRNKILIPITTGFMAGMGSTAAASTMQGMTAGSMGSTLAGYGAAIGTGLSNFGSAALHTVTGGSMGSVAAGSTMASIGAVAPYILAAVAVIGLFTSKVKKLDEGVRVTVNGMDTLVESFETLQKSRLFGLLKSKPFTEYKEVDDSPIVEAVASMQDSILKAAESLGIGTEAFNDFSYQFQVSLQGLTDEEKIQKINEELAKMGDAFASLSGHFTNMNDLLAVAQQRYDLETRLLQLQGDATALLTRQREREIATTHDLNLAMLAQIHAVEDANRAVDQAFAAVQRSIQARKDSITRSFNEIMETIQLRISEASETVGLSRSILSSLEGASGSSDMTREAGLAYLRELRGASRISDQKKLDKALKAISEPSEGLYKNFVDYQRDFSDQRNLIRELEDKAGVQLGIDEQTLLELQEQAEATRTRHEEQLAALDEQLQQAQNQINELRNIDTSVKSVEEALGDLEKAIMAAIEANAAAKKLQAGGGGVAQDIQSANAAGAKVIEELGSAGVAIRKSDGAAFEKVVIRGADQLKEVANSIGIATKGKTGAQIQQEISNVGNIGVNMDNATRAERFALGGYFSGGLRMVGERGPELEMTGPSRIMSNNDTRKMLQNPDLVEAVKDMKQEISELRNEQRQLGINNNKYTKRTYDLYRQWDTEGLPTERT